MKSIDELLTLAYEDKGKIALIKTFWQPWSEQVENCAGRIKNLRSLFEWLSDLADKMVYISWEMTARSQEVEAVENKRRNMDPVFSDKFTETMAESVAANEQKF